MSTPLVAVAHGSRDPRSAATVHELLDVLRSRRPELDVRAAFLDLSAPKLPDVLTAVHAEGHRRTVVVPLLLGRAYHARIDIPGAVAAVSGRHPLLDVRVADVLGPDDRLEAAALRRLAAEGIDPDDDRFGVVLTGAGSSHEPANTAVRAVARRWAERSRWAGVVAAFASAAGPDVPTAVAALRARGARRIALGSWFLAPGLLPDRCADLALVEDPDTVIARPLGAAPEVADVIADRYREVAGVRLNSARAG